MFRGGRRQRAGASCVARYRSDVQEADVGGVALDEGAPLLDVVTHEDREGLVGVGRLIERDLLEDPGRGVHGRLPQLVVVHLAQTLVALDPAVLGQATALLLPCGQQLVALDVGVGELVLGVGPLEPVERRHGETGGVFAPAAVWLRPCFAGRAVCRFGSRFARYFGCHAGGKNRATGHGVYAGDARPIRSRAPEP